MAGSGIPRSLRFERLALHHMAPVTGGVPNGKEDRLVFRARFFKRLIAPRKPVDGIVGVLLKIWAFLGTRRFARMCFLQENTPPAARGGTRVRPRGTIWFESEARRGSRRETSTTSGNKAIGPNPARPRGCGGALSHFVAAPLQCPALLTSPLHAGDRAGARNAAPREFHHGLIVDSVDPMKLGWMKPLFSGI